jgi:Trk K+ transport system NAD-binding subunit
MNILLIKRNGEAIVPQKDDVLHPKDIIIIFGKKKDADKITTFFKNYVEYIA